MARNRTKRRASFVLKTRWWHNNVGDPMAVVKCYWCPRLINFYDATIDHEPPLSEGGERSKFVIACDECNQRRGREITMRRNKGMRRAKDARESDIATKITQEFLNVGGLPSRKYGEGGS